METLFNSWQPLYNKPYYFFFYYVPYRLSKLPGMQFNDYSLSCQRYLWNFKDGIGQDSFFKMFESLIRFTFKGDLKDLALVCIPASTRASNELRYKNFSEAVCSALNIHNGFQHIEIVREKEPKHISNIETSAEYRFDSSFFQGKKVVLFDDVVTKGHSMLNFTRQLEQYGAEVIAYVSLGRTYNEYCQGHDPIHPFDRFHLRSFQVEPASPNTFTNQAYLSMMQSIQAPTQPHTNNSEDTVQNVEDACKIEQESENRETSALDTQVQDQINISKKDESSAFLTEPIVKKESTTYLNLLEIADKRYEAAGSSKPQKYGFGKIFRFGRFNDRVLDWQVIANNGQEVILITRYGIHNRPYNDVLENTTWEECSLRKWLNDDFLLNAFTDEERKKIITQNVKAEVVNGHELNPGHDTQDKVSILSFEEYCKLYKSHWKCVLQSTGKLRQCWVRNYGVDRMHGGFIGRSGSLHEGGSLVNSPRNAVRPVIVMRIKDLV